jgi:mono/diheme cytochrome c family protein
MADQNIFMRQPIGKSRHWLMAGFCRAKAVALVMAGVVIAGCAHEVAAVSATESAAAAVAAPPVTDTVPASQLAPASATRSSAQDTAQLIKQGKRVYGSACARCHGVDMVNTGGSTFDLRTFPLNEKDRFVNSVLHGKGAMPAWEGAVSAEEVEALWAYVSAR